MPHDVFLSYASHDRAAADAVCAALERRGIKCWMAPRDVRAGEDWGEAILTAIGRAHAMVLILSRSTAGSAHVRNEVVTAVSQGLALVPVRIEDCQPGGALRLHLAGSHWLAGYPPPIEQHADAMAAGVRLALAADATIELPRGQAAAWWRRRGRPRRGWRRPAARPPPPMPRPLPQALPVYRPGGRWRRWRARRRIRTGPRRAAPGRRAMLLAGLAVLLLAGALHRRLVLRAAAVRPVRRAAAGRRGSAGPPRGRRAGGAAGALAGLGGPLPLQQAPFAANPAPSPPRSLAQAPPVPVPPARILNLAGDTIHAAARGAGACRDRPAGLVGHAQITPATPCRSAPTSARLPVRHPRRLCWRQDRGSSGGCLCAGPRTAFRGGQIHRRLLRRADAGPPAPPPAELMGSRDRHPQPFLVINAGPAAMVALELSPAGENRFGDSLFGRVELPPGNALHVTPPSRAGCLNDLRIRWADGRSEDRAGEDLCRPRRVLRLESPPPLNAQAPP